MLRTTSALAISLLLVVRLGGSSDAARTACVAQRALPDDPCTAGAELREAARACVAFARTDEACAREASAAQRPYFLFRAGAEYIDAWAILGSRDHSGANDRSRGIKIMHQLAIDDGAPEVLRTRARSFNNVWPNSP